MAPIITIFDSFAHQTLSVGTLAGSGLTGIYDASAGTPTFDTTVLRTPYHLASMKFVENGTTAQRVSRAIPAGNRLVVGSFYFRATAAPTVKSNILLLQGPTNPPQFFLNVTTGTLIAQTTNASAQQTAANVCDSLWHRVDFRADVSTATFTMDWMVDGVPQTQVSAAGTSADFTFWTPGSVTTTHTATFWMQDPVISYTTGDYPIGPHLCLAVYPLGEGTDALGTTNKIVDQGGGTTNLYTTVDEWNGGLPNTTDYVTYTSTTLGDAASNFAEFTFQPLPGWVIGDLWDVQGIIAGQCSTTGSGAVPVDTQVLTAHGGTLIDHIGNLVDYLATAAGLGYFRQKLARPSGGWTKSGFNGIVAQWGRATSTATLPRLSTIMLEVVVAEAYKQTIRSNKEALHRSARW